MGVLPAWHGESVDGPSQRNDDLVRLQRGITYEYRLPLPVQCRWATNGPGDRRRVSGDDRSRRCPETVCVHRTACRNSSPGPKSGGRQSIRRQERSRTTTSMIGHRLSGWRVYRHLGRTSHHEFNACIVRSRWSVPIHPRYRMCQHRTNTNANIRSCRRPSSRYTATPPPISTKNQGKFSKNLRTIFKFSNNSRPRRKIQKAIASV